MALHLRPNEMVRYPGYFPEPGTAMHRGEVTGQSLLGLVPASNQTARLVYRFDCATGCTPFPPFMCDAILRAAVLDACRMALSAARKLESRPVDAATATLFRSVFGHDPWDPFPGTWIIASGDVACCLFRMVESALRLGNVLYRCDPCIGTREDPAAGSIIDAHAIAIPAQNLALLCPSFWSLSRFLKAGVLLHEMFHLRFQPFFKHDLKERRQNSAYCYEVFALSAVGHTPEPISISRCQAVPIM
jgi:hypothetical protein